MRGAATAAMGLMFGLLLYRLWMLAVLGWGALHWPYELDYAEGIVWEQARLMLTPEAYGPIDGFPTIVFHYTPLYHLVTRAVASLSATDMLYVGRAVSMVCTGLIALVVGLIVMTVAPADMSRKARLIMATAGGLVVFSLYPIMLSALLMRVDMLAVLLSMTGFWLGLKAFERPALIHTAAICFVAAIYTKQTSLAAPAAIFAVLLWQRPRVALAGIASCILLGGTIFATLIAVTHGGFFRHIFLYNINRVSLHRLLFIFEIILLQAPFVGIALIAVVRGFRERRAGSGSAEAQAEPERKSGVVWLCLLAYLATSSLMLLTVAKSGAYLNYFVEWLSVLSVLVGCALGDAARVTSDNSGREYKMSQFLFGAVVVPLTIAVHAAIGPGPDVANYWAPKRKAEVEALAAIVQNARKPVVSDEMVMMIRVGKRVLWEPMIFTELASTGVWDEKSFVDRIRNRDFAMFITVTNHNLSRDVTTAIHASYPLTRNYAEYTVHLVRDAADRKSNTREN
jgi:hypothetical protein